jgi:hypothetical protein
VNAVVSTPPAEHREHSVSPVAAAQALVLARLGSDPWKKITELERDLAKLPQQEMPLNHVFTPGLYQRSIFMPAGTLLTSRIHLTEHPFVISMGVISVWSDDAGWQTFNAVHMGVTKPGTRRVLFAHTDTIWTTTHANPEDIRDPEKMVERVTFDHLKLSAGGAS